MYHDTTPLLGSHNSGTIELDHGVARCLGVEPSWWIAVALAYIEFLQERDVSSPPPLSSLNGFLIIFSGILGSRWRLISASRVLNSTYNNVIERYGR